MEKIWYHLANQRMYIYILNCRYKNTADYTCYTTLCKSVADYLLTNSRDLKCLGNFKVLPKRIESDHCILYFELNVNAKRQESTNVQDDVHMINVINTNGIKPRYLYI